MVTLSRRLALKIIGLLPAGFAFGRANRSARGAKHGDDAPAVGRWHQAHDRVWLGEEFWANPMEDWRIVDGAAECQSSGGNRNIHLLTHQLTDTGGRFAMSVAVERVETAGSDGGAGFRIGIKSDINEHKSNCFAAGGVNAGLVDDRLRIGGKSRELKVQTNSEPTILELSGRPDGDRYALTLAARSPSGELLGTMSHTVSPDDVTGNVALVNNFNARVKRKNGTRYRFGNWRVSGSAFTVSPQQKFGPILWSMYTLSDSRSPEGFVLNVSALCGPLGERDNKTVELQIERAGGWQKIAQAELDPDAWVATFRVANWDATAATPYRLVYRAHDRDGTHADFHWSGTIRAYPVGRPLRLAALTCQKDYAFPYEPVAANLRKLDPDLLYFSGDQLYEDHGGFGLIRDPAGPAILNYLRKFYMFGWAFREVMRDRPTVCIPDDHDVFQGNIWGEGGAKMSPGGTSSQGGYREPARMVNVVHRTCAGHHPDPFDPAPCKQQISVYFGELVYGRVGFAILGDRQFKSGPEHVDTGEGRADHVTDPKFDTSTLDKEGLVLLGPRQEKFLEHWVDDWRGHEMKVLLSQTVFAGVATHHGRYDGYLKADLDCGGWPQTPRNNAIRIVRRGIPLHINGDQHLTSLVQYGVAAQRDSCWSFCTPAIAAGYPRWWRPDEVGMPHQKRPRHGLPNTGEFRDGFGNLVYVYAVGNPEVGTKQNRYERAHQKGSGFGLVTIDTDQKTYKLEAFRFLVDATDGASSNQFPGWPLTLHQRENAGENVAG